MRPLIFLVVVFLAAFSAAFAQTDEPGAAANQSLLQLHKLTTEQHYKVLGFASREEVASATLGEPITVYMVQLDQLQKYKAGNDPNLLLKATNETIFPVIAKGIVRSSIVTVKGKEGWEAKKYGGSNSVKLLAKVRKDISDSTRSPVSSFFSVKVPALNLVFIARRAENVLLLTPVFDDPSMGLKSGSTIPATEVFSKLASFAREHDGSPR